MKFCPECGAKLIESHKFCGECGADLRKIINENTEIKEINKNQFDLNSFDLDNDVQTFGGTSFDSFGFNNGINNLNQNNKNNDLTKNELKALEPFETIKLSDGTYAIKSLRNKSEIIVNVPSYVSVIGDEAFAGSDILEVTLSEGLIKIGNRAFANCKDLDTINFPKSLHMIGDEAFSGCSQLDIKIPNSIRCGKNVLKETKCDLKK